MIAINLSNKDLEDDPVEKEEGISGNFVAFTARIDGTKYEPTEDIDQSETEKIPYVELEDSYV